MIGAALSVQRSVERPDNTPLEPAADLAVTGAYAAGAVFAALWPIGRRDA